MAETQWTREEEVVHRLGRRVERGLGRAGGLAVVVRSLDFIASVSGSHGKVLNRGLI